MALSVDVHSEEMDNVLDIKLLSLTKVVLVTSFLSELPNDVIYKIFQPKIVAKYPTEVLQMMALFYLVCRAEKDHVDNIVFGDNYVNERAHEVSSRDYKAPSYDSDGLPYYYYPSDYSSDYQKLSIIS